MLPSKLATLTLAACLILPTRPADAQLGGLIKKKVGEAVKGPDNSKEKGGKAAETADDGSKLGFKLDDDVLGAFEAGLSMEIRERDAFRKKIASIKTPEQYGQCGQDVMRNPEGQKFAVDYGEAMTKLGDNAAGKKAEQIMKEQQDLAEQFAKRSNSLTLKYCGEDPAPTINSQRRVFEQAQKAAAMEFGKVFNRSGSNDEPDALPEESCAGGSAVLAEDDVVSADSHCHSANPLAKLAGVIRSTADSTSDQDKEHRYALLKEWIAKFCSLSKSTQQEAASVGIKVAGSGTGIFWVYTKEEAQKLIAKCDALTKKLMELQ
jgi:hypothetical protein